MGANLRRTSDAREGRWRRALPGIQLGAMQLADALDANVMDTPDRVATIIDWGDGVRSFTWQELSDRANRLAAHLDTIGIRDGDRVLCCLPNGIEFLDTWLACNRLGAIFVPANTMYRERELGHMAQDADPALIVTNDEMRPFFPTAYRWLSDRDVQALAEQGSVTPMRRPLSGDAPAALVYTSGTTGRSKGAILTHHNLLSNGANLLASWRISATDRYLATLPLFHVHGLGNGVMSWLLSGCTMRLRRRFDAAHIAEDFASFRPTLFFGVPTMYVRLLELSSEAAQTIGAGMRLFVCGSAPLPAETLMAFKAYFGHTILERYGMSETLMNLGNPYAGERRAGTVGVPFPGVSVRIVDRAGTDVPDGTVGELLVRGPNVCAGYWRRPEADSAFADGWFRTGDLGERSTDGYVTLRGRQSDLIISGGFNIYPREVEEVLLTVPGVLEAAVTAAPDARRGEVPVAWIVAPDLDDTDAVLAHCRTQLASFKVPRTITRVAAIPRNAMGKVVKHELPTPGATS